MYWRREGGKEKDKEENLSRRGKEVERDKDEKEEKEEEEEKEEREDECYKKVVGIVITVMIDDS